MLQTVVEEAKYMNEPEYDFKIVHRMIWEHLYIRVGRGLQSGKARQARCVSAFHLGIYLPIVNDFVTRRSVEDFYLLMMEANMKEKVILWG